MFEQITLHIGHECGTVWWLLTDLGFVRSSLAIFASKLFSVLEKFLAIFKQFFGKVRSEWMFRFGIVNQRHQRLNNCQQNVSNINREDLKLVILPWSVLVAGFQFSALIIGKQTWPFSSMFGW